MDKQIAVVAFEGISPFHLSIPSLVFGEDRSEDGIPVYDVTVCAVRTGLLKTSAGYSIVVNEGLAALDSADMVIIPSWTISESPPDALRTSIISAHNRGAIVVGLCLGAFVVASTGLLDGRRATTHWRYASTLANRYPAIQVDEKVLWVDHGDIITSAGTVASIDCCLYLIRKDYGGEVANRVARRLVIPPHRMGNQAQFIERPLATTDQNANRVHEAMHWMRTHLAWPVTVEQLAKQAKYSRRHFTRQFRAVTGTSPLQWLLIQRLKYAQELLETTGLTVSQIAERCGFGSEASLRQHFVQAFHINPRAYRQGFRRDSEPSD